MTSASFSREIHVALFQLEDFLWISIIRAFSSGARLSCSRAPGCDKNSTVIRLAKSDDFVTQEDWYYKDADERGFASFVKIRRHARQTTREQFVQDFPVPALLVRPNQEETVTVEPPAPEDEGMQLVTAMTEGAAILRFLNRIAFLCKRPGNRYAHLVYVGRSATNDISITVDSVSKVHGYFARDGEDWCFHDLRSTNGSLLNGQPVEAGQKNMLRDEDVLQLGLEVTLEFFSPERLYDHVTRG